MRTQLYGPRAQLIEPIVAEHPGLELVERDPEIIVCYGGDGTLLAAELEFPNIPKVPIRNSRRGRKLIGKSPEEVIAYLAEGKLIENRFIKLRGQLCLQGDPEPVCSIAAMNEFNVHMGRINSAVRFRIWVDDLPYANGLEILGDGFVVCTPFGSTAYYNQITRGFFRQGLGMAFKYTAEHTSHMVLPEDACIRVRITRGPAVLAYDSAQDYYSLVEGDELLIERHSEHAIIYTWHEHLTPSDVF